MRAEKFLKLQENRRLKSFLTRYGLSGFTEELITNEKDPRRRQLLLLINLRRSNYKLFITGTTDPINESEFQDLSKLYSRMSNELFMEHMLHILERRASSLESRNCDWRRLAENHPSINARAIPADLEASALLSVTASLESLNRENYNHHNNMVMCLVTGDPSALTQFYLNIASELTGCDFKPDSCDLARFVCVLRGVGVDVSSITQRQIDTLGALLGNSGKLASIKFEGFSELVSAIQTANALGTAELLEITVALVHSIQQAVASNTTVSLLALSRDEEFCRKARYLPELVQNNKDNQALFGLEDNNNLVATRDCCDSLTKYAVLEVLRDMVLTSVTMTVAAPVVTFGLGRFFAKTNKPNFPVPPAGPRSGLPARAGRFFHTAAAPRVQIPSAQVPKPVNNFFERVFGGQQGLQMLQPLRRICRR